MNSAVHVSQDVFDYNRKKLCNLYDSSQNTKGQAYDIVYTNELNGWKEITFHIPFVIDDKRNFRWNYIRNEYLLRMIRNDEVEWFIIHSPKKTKGRKAITNTVTCSHLSSILKTKNLYMTFDDSNGIGTLPYLMEQALKATGWTLGICDTFLERDGKTEKVRSLKNEGKAGSYQLITEICNLFNAYPVFDGDAKTVNVYALGNKGDLKEMTMGKDIESLTVSYNSDDIITRLYVEGEYGDDGYVGIDDVNPTGLTYLMNFDYYKEIGLFTDAHQEAQDEYYATMKSAVATIRSVAGLINEKENSLNSLWGQCNYVFYVVTNGAISKTIIGGTVTAEDLIIAEGDDITIISQNKEYRVVTAGVNGFVSLTTSDKYAIKFITPPSAEIGAKEVAVEAKKKLIQNLRNRITESTSDEKKADINAQIAKLEDEILDLYIGTEEDIYLGTELETGLYDLMTSAAELVMDLNALAGQREEALTEQEEVEVEFAISMGDMLKDGYWNNSNYAAGQEEFQYADALDVIKQMSKPEVSYSISRVSLEGVVGRPIIPFDQNSKVRIYDADLGVNDFAYVSSITSYLDKPESDTVDISTQDIALTGLTLDSILSRITKLADLIDQKNSLYNRSEAIGKDGSIFVDRLEGKINILKNQILSSTSNWYTDANGNLVFESSTGKSAMMLCGEGFMIAYGRDNNGEWNWRTFGTGEGFTADAIITGYQSADRIEARSITANKLAADVGSSLDLSSNTSIKLVVEDSVVEQVGYSVGITSSNGFFLSSKANHTILCPLVKNGTSDITSTLPNSAFSWSRNTGNDDEDSVWNSQHASIKNQEITLQDVRERAQFTCSVHVTSEKTISENVSLMNLDSVKRLDVFVESNHPTIQVYDPNGDGEYRPDWTSSPLVLTPRIYVDDNLIQNSDSSVSISWSRIVGSSAEQFLTSDAVLAVSKNDLDQSDTNGIIYRCKVTYTNNITRGVVVGQCDTSFSLATSGRDGEQGIQGEPGTNGQSSYFHLKYSSVSNPTASSQMKETPDTYIGTYVDSTPQDSADPSDYNWCKFQGTDGIAGINGENGQTSYLHIKYSNDGGTTFTDNNGETAGDYIGQYVDFIKEDSSDVKKYIWKKIVGEKGADGQTYYTWIKYADSPTTGMSDTPEGKKYMGIAYNQLTQTESSNYGDYYWSLIKGEDGSDGINGVPGADGKTYYTWVKYADDANGKNMSNDPTGKYYIGLSYNNDSPTESDNVSNYTWSLFRGADGVDGSDGKDGITYYTWIKYADTPTSGMSDVPEGKKYIGIAYNQTTQTESTQYSKYKWSLIKGEDGSDGTNGVDGADGITYYTWVKYADDASGKNMSNDSTGKYYIGLAYNKLASVESEVASDYKWSLFRGADGVDGTDGKDGKDGTGVTILGSYDTESQLNTAHPNGSPGDSYIVNGDLYVWSATQKKWLNVGRIQGPAGADGTNGTDGTNGKDGLTYYLHIAYANNSTGTSGFSTTVSTNKLYIGQYVDTTLADSTDPTKYKWTRIKGADGQDGQDGQDGENAILLTLYTPNGSVFTNGAGSLKIQALAYDGSTDISNTATFVWHKLSSTSWTSLSGTSNSITVSGSTVSGIGIFRCTMTYKSKTYIAIATLTDKTDNYQVSIVSSSGDVFFAGVPSTTLKCRVFQNGTEVDENGTAFTYSWSRLDKNGTLLDANGYAAGKSITVPSSAVNDVTTFVCETVNGSSGQFTQRSMSSVITYSNTAPTNPYLNMLWMDTSNESQDILKRWNGENWIETTITQSEIDGLYSTLSSYRTEISQLSKSIELRVTEEQLNTKLNGKADLDWVSRELTSIIEQTSKDITFQFEQAKEFTVESTSEFQDFIKEVKSYQRFSADGQELGMLNSPFIAKLGNTKLSFIQDGTEIAYISNNKLYITEAQVTSKLSIGTDKYGFFDWITTDTGLGLKWKG